MGFIQRAVRRSIFYFIGKAFILVGASLLGWMGDLPWNVRPPAQESPFARAKQKFSYWTWCVLPLALIYVGFGAVVILPVSVFMAFVVSLHRMGIVGVPLYPRRFASVWATTLSSPLHWAVLLIAGLATPVLFEMLELAAATTALYTAYAAWILTAHWVSIAASRWHVEDRRLTAKHGPALATVFRTSLAAFDADGEFHMEGEALVISPAPAAAVSKREDVESQLALVMPEWEMDQKRSNHSRLVLVPTSMETGDRRAALADSGGLLVAASHTAEDTDKPSIKTKTVKLPAGIALDSVAGHAEFHSLVQKKVGAGWNIQEVVEGKAVLVKGVADARPSAATWALSADLGEKEAAVKAGARAERMGLSLVQWDFDRRRAVVANTLPVVRALRSRLAEALRCLEHEVELNIAWQDQGPSLVTILRAPRPNVDSFKRREFWLAEIPTIVGTPRGHRWTYTEDATTGAVRMGCGIDPLSAIVKYNEDPSIGILPTDPWQVGVDEAGDIVQLDLAGSAHLLIAGATRSGKSVATYGLITHVLRMGDCARLLVADPNDTTIAPFEHLVSWGTSSTEPEPVTAMLQWVRLEMDRRKPILRKMRQDKVSEFTPELPLIVVVIDEAANYMRHSKGDEAKAMTTELLAVASQGAKYGVRVILITQRPDSTILPTAIRSQLSARMSFRLEDMESAKMTFPDIEDPAELLTFDVGVGLIKEVAGKPRRFRSAYLEDHWGAADQISAPLVKINVHSDPSAYSARPAVLEPDVVDLGEMELSLDDLDLSEMEMTMDPVDGFGAEPVSLAKRDLDSAEDETPDPFAEPVSLTKAPVPVTNDGFDFGNNTGGLAVRTKPKTHQIPALDPDNPFA